MFGAQLHAQQQLLMAVRRCASVCGGLALRLDVKPLLVCTP
jgi:hypothetical protein